MPTEIPIGIDFETYYTAQYSVKTMGTQAYANSPEFKCLLVGASDVKNSWSAAPADFDWDPVNGMDWVSHNREFDQAVFERLKSDGIVPKHIAPKAWYCSAAIAAYRQFPRALNACSEAVLGNKLNKTVRKLFRKNQDFSQNPEAKAYVEADARASAQIFGKLTHLWPERERKLYDITCEMCAKGVFIDREKVEASINKLKESLENLTGALPFQPSGSPKKFKEACRKNGLAYPDSTDAKSPEFMAWASKNPDSLALKWIQTMQEIRSLNRLLKTFKSILRRVQSNNRMPYDLKYCGANTGRWSGGGGLNMQNLNSSSIEGINLRHMITAPPGKTLAILDFAQIEPRVLLHLAGDTATLQRIRGGEDLYEAHARETMDYNDPRPLEEVNPNMRKLAKARVLGLGYGCGKERFVEVAKSMAGLELTLDQAAATVDNYRRTNTKITALWNRYDAEFKAHHGKHYYLALPRSSQDPTRKLIYRNVDAHAGVATVAGEETRLYGGKLVENLTQATARDILAEAWIRCYDDGFKPILSIHDELVFELDEDKAEEQLRQIVRLMEQPVDWAPEIPLKVKGTLSRHYKK